MRIWPILLIKSDLKWWIHLSGSIFLYLQLSQSACLRWPNVGSGSYGWLLVGVGFITLNQRWANVYNPRYQRMYRIHWLDLLDQRWANVFSPHYHRLLEYFGYHLLDKHSANVCSPRYHWLLWIRWLSCNGCGMPTEDAYSSGHLVLSHFGTCMCSYVETNLSWTCLVSGPLNFEHPSVLLFCFMDQHWTNVCSPHYHWLLEYVGCHLLDQFV